MTGPFRRWARNREHPKLRQQIEAIPYPQDVDAERKAARIAHARQVLADGAMSGPADLAVFRSDMHDMARRAARPETARPAGVPSCGNPPIG